MVKAFSVISWNVKHFKKKENESADAARITRVVSLLKQQDPDVIALYEVTGKEVFTEMTIKFQALSFSLHYTP